MLLAIKADLYKTLSIYTLTCARLSILNNINYQHLPPLGPSVASGEKVIAITSGTPSYVRLPNNGGLRLMGSWTFATWLWRLNANYQGPILEYTNG